jgi:hypothetical protein
MLGAMPEGMSYESVRALAPESISIVSDPPVVLDIVLA